MDKVTIFGAGHVGATTAFYLALSASLELALVDVAEGRALALALDIEQSLPYTGSRCRVEGGGDPGLVEGSDLVMITAGYPREPGMSRSDLTARNAPVVASIAREVARSAPGAVVIVVTNPVDEMTYLAREAGGFEDRRVMGMAGVLDTSRFLYFLDRMGSLRPDEVRALVLGSHGDEMVPLTEWSRAGEEPLSETLDKDLLALCVERTRDAGAEIVGHMRTGSAYFAPAVSLGIMALAILGDTGRILPVSTFLLGEYGIDGVFLGVPARLGRGGVQEVIELELSGQERTSLSLAAENVRERISVLGAVLNDEDA